MVVQNCHSVVLKQKHLVRECGYQQLVIAEFRKVKQELHELPFIEGPLLRFKGRQLGSRSSLSRVQLLDALLCAVGYNPLLYGRENVSIGLLDIGNALGNVVALRFRVA